MVRATHPLTLQWEENLSYVKLKPLESLKAGQKGQLLHVDKRGFIKEQSFKEPRLEHPTAHADPWGGEYQVHSILLFYLGWLQLLLGKLLPAPQVLLTASAAPWPCL